VRRIYFELIKPKTIRSNRSEKGEGNCAHMLETTTKKFKTSKYASFLPEPPHTINLFQNSIFTCVETKFESFHPKNKNNKLFTLKK